MPGPGYGRLRAAVGPVEAVNLPALASVGQCSRQGHEEGECGPVDPSGPGTLGPAVYTRVRETSGRGRASPGAAGTESGGGLPEDAVRSRQGGRWRAVAGSCTREPARGRRGVGRREQDKGGRRPSDPIPPVGRSPTVTAGDAPWLGGHDCPCALALRKLPWPRAL